MMKLADSFLQIFDKTKAFVSADSSSTHWIITEKNSDAGIKRLFVDMNKAEYIAFDDMLCRSMPNITTQRSSIIEDSECDGIAMAEKDGRLLFIFCDLKPTFDTCKIIKAFKQDLLSFLKIKMLLSICNGFNFDDCDIDFIVACKCFATDEKRTEFISRLQMKQIAKVDAFTSRILFPLLENGEKCVKLGDFPQIAGLDINPCIKNKKVKLRLLMSSNYTDDFVKYSI
ncbi:MAG: hypothetical protein IKC70_04380 [Bacteroidaceae bacterium]|nr:hypothetical protein [Bacteroidaceae bacterium]